jgi:hypothetical protein
MNAGDHQPICNNGVVKIRLVDARQTCLMTLDWSLVAHISATDSSGWVFLGTYAPRDPIPPSGWFVYTDEILQLKLDGSEIRRLIHHRSRPFNSYVYQPKPSVSRDGAKLAYASNFGMQQLLGYPTQYSDAYLVDLSSSSPGTGGGSDDTDGSGEEPAPEEPPSPAVIRVDQTDAAITYRARWSTFTSNAFSGGTATASSAKNGRVTFTFDGVGVKWIGYRNDATGIARVYVDDVLQAEVDTYSAAAEAQQTIYAISGLTPGRHKLVIDVAGSRNPSSTGNWIWVDAFEFVPNP